MLPPIPYFDRAGYERRSAVPPTDIDALAALYPGYLERRIARGSSWTNARLQKRYVTPLGQAAPVFQAVGTSPPPIVLAGRPVLGSLELTVQVLAPGVLGVGTFWWSTDAGQTWTLGTELAATGTSPPAVSLTGTGELDAPDDLVVAVTTAGTLGTARFQWSDDGGDTWVIAGTMASSGTSPPLVVLTGTSLLALPSDVQIQITTAGTLGTAIFQWSLDGGVTWTTGLQTMAVPIPLGNTGLTATFALGTYATNNAYQGQGQLAAASFPLPETGFALGFPAGTYSADNVFKGQGIVLPSNGSFVFPGSGLTATLSPGTYSGDNVYAAPTPVPEVALGWLAAMLDVDVWKRRGANPQDPAIEEAIKERDTALAEIKEAADSEAGLFELPLLDTTGGSAVNHGGPLCYSEASPFVSADRQEREGLHEDIRGRGTYGGR